MPQPEMLGYLGKIFKLGLHLAVAANSLALVLAEHLASWDFRGHGQIANLVQEVATAAGCMVTFYTLTSRQVLPLYPNLTGIFFLEPLF